MNADRTAPATITEEQWRDLQARAQAANPARYTLGTREQRRGDLHAARNYRKRRHC